MPLLARIEANAASGQRQRQGCSLVAARDRDNATDYWQKA